ncbi:cilia- and flagella-associated protein 53 [Halyomorpha halys]|uniref:cilia- and flagella-associated protein 53 n=1 Tax=Halyomorpha halys TaxID=286706 RepID=UPI0006D4E793|nr:uncharacterized protein LOC106688782 [Halyomorpha halys]
MQRKKVFDISLFLDLHAVTCPGVWLCPKGKVAVCVAIFGVSESTKKLEPSFPLFFHERFHFQKKYKKASNLHQLERVLHRVPVTLQLLQFPQGTTEYVKLAEFKATVGDIIYPPGGDMDLLFSTTNTFPGIIGPKGEVTTRLTLTEGGIKDNAAAPTTVLSKGMKGKQTEEPVIRQKPVCHTKHYLYCGCFDKNAQPRMLAKTMKRRQEILAKKRTSQEAIRPSPAHIISHKNHGDILPGYKEYKYDDGGVKFGKCNCCQDQSVFRATSTQSQSRMSEESSIRGKNMKDGFTISSIPQSELNQPVDYKYDKIVPEEEEEEEEIETIETFSLGDDKLEEEEEEPPVAPNEEIKVDTTKQAKEEPIDKDLIYRDNEEELFDSDLNTDQTIASEKLKSEDLVILPSESDPEEQLQKLLNEDLKHEISFSDIARGFMKQAYEDELERIEEQKRLEEEQKKLEEEKKKSEEERREIADFRNKVASLHEQSLEQRIQQEIRQPFRINNNIKSGRTSQTKLLAGAVIKKRPSETKSEAKENPKRLRPLSEDNNNEGVDSGERVSVTAEHEEPKAGSLTCIGILPGVGNYDISSDESDCSTDIEDDKVRYDLLGRRIKKKCKSN